jgi:HJR/Mrr/RecB family endonuclease
MRYLLLMTLFFYILVTAVVASEQTDLREILITDMMQYTKEDKNTAKNPFEALIETDSNRESPDKMETNSNKESLDKENNKDFEETQNYYQGEHYLPSILFVLTIIVFYFVYKKYKNFCPKSL